MKTLFFTVVITLFATISLAQNVGIGTNTPDASAKLDITSSNSGLLIPRVSLSSTTDVATISSPATSLLVYNTNASITSGDGVGYYYYDGTQWVKLSTGSTSEDWSLTGNSGTNATSNFLGTTDATDLVFRTNNNEQMRIKSSGYIGVGTTTPTSRFDVRQSINTNNYSMSNFQLTSQNTTGIATSIFARSTGTGTGNYFGLYSQVNGTSGGQTAIYAFCTATSTANYGLRGVASGSTSGTNYGVYGQAYNATTNWAGYFNGNTFSTSGVWTASDMNLKRDVQNYSGAISDLNRINIYTYFFNRTDNVELNLPETRQYGVMAQELEKIFPEMVLSATHTIPVGDEGNEKMISKEIKTVNYSQLIPILIKASQEQQEIIEKQEKHLSEQEARIAELERLVKQMIEKQK